MRLEEIPFTEYYHQFLVIEADDLTEKFKEEVEIKEEDCFALCSSYCGKDGLVEFNVLAVGNAWDSCTKGLHRKKMLGSFTIDEVIDCEAKVIEPTMKMLEKNTPFLQKKDAVWDEDILSIRLDERLDDLRDLFYPDVVLTGIVVDKMIMEYSMRITGVKGPFLVGELEEEPEMDIGLHYGDSLWALAYALEDSCRLFALFAGENLSDDEKEVRDRILDEMDRVGIRFNGIGFKN